MDMGSAEPISRCRSHINVYAFFFLSFFHLCFGSHLFLRQLYSERTLRPNVYAVCQPNTEHGTNGMNGKTRQICRVVNCTNRPTDRTNAKHQNVDKIDTWAIRRRRRRVYIVCDTIDEWIGRPTAGCMKCTRAVYIKRKPDARPPK